MQKQNDCRHWMPHALTGLLALLAVCSSHASLAQNPAVLNSIPVPDGYQRRIFPPGSFSSYIQNLALKNPAVIRDYRGEIVNSAFYNVLGVVRMPLLFSSDLEQCADFAMRFWAEYHKAEGKLDQFYLFDYGGNKKQFKLSGKSLVQFLRTSFANSNSHSLKQGCKPVTADELIPGDMLVQNERGGVGHVSVIMDVCQSKEEKRLFLIGYSFMPAQEFHIERAGEKYGIRGWFTFEGYTQFLKDHLDFGKPVLRRFEP